MESLRNTVALIAVASGGSVLVSLCHSVTLLASLSVRVSAISGIVFRCFQDSDPACPFNSQCLTRQFYGIIVLVFLCLCLFLQFLPHGGMHLHTIATCRPTVQSYKNGHLPVLVLVWRYSVLRISAAFNCQSMLGPWKKEPFPFL